MARTCSAGFRGNLCVYLIDVNNIVSVPVFQNEFQIQQLYFRIFTDYISEPFGIIDEPDTLRKRIPFNHWLFWFWVLHKPGSAQFAAHIDWLLMTLILNGDMWNLPHTTQSAEKLALTWDLLGKRNQGFAANITDTHGVHVEFINAGSHCLFWTYTHKLWFRLFLSESSIFLCFPFPAMPGFKPGKALRSMAKRIGEGAGCPNFLR